MILSNGFANALWRALHSRIGNMSVKPLVICGPSGVGKSTLLKRLMIEFKDYLGFSVSHTTRQPRPGEQNGVHYHFVNSEDMSKAIKSGELIEHAVFAGNTYGTSRKAVEEVTKQNKICILDIEIEGVKQVKKSDIDPVYVFVKPPSIECLEERLKGRGTETIDSLSRRLSVARKEIAFGEAEGNFDLIIVNDDVEKAYNSLKNFVLPIVSQLRSQF